jgi:ubiquinone/menaquinone biosynthesis C-methylase UbiE
MISPVEFDNERLATAAFNSQSKHFDELYAPNAIFQYKRKRVRDHLLSYLKPGSNILELNAGTGDDAVFLAQHGHLVHATDISEGMQEKLKEKAAWFGLSGSVSAELCSFTTLNSLNNKGPYDCIFSNFAGLNCTDRLDKVLASFDGLLKPGGLVVLVMLPRFCLWESLLIFRGKFKTATRRFFSSKGRKANIEGFSFMCWYYSPGVIKGKMKEKYKLLRLEGLCTIVPPSYLENFPEKYPGVYSFLCNMENRFCKIWPWNKVGDYFISSFRKKQIPGR